VFISIIIIIILNLVPSVV